jgi:molybdopterin-biosynthesis enzyme MoeA-like protein
MKIGAVIIGDEILSGKRQDKHFNHLQTVLAKRGLELSWTMMVGDDPDDLLRFLAFSMSSKDLVFSFGGIGATPDDRTRQTVAKIAEVSLYPHPEALAEIEQQYGAAAYPKRVLMAELPEGSRIIPNTINRVPGFSFDDHHFMPGFPEMSWPMIQWVLDNLYPDLHHLAPEMEDIIYVLNGKESDLIDAMETIVRDYPELRLSSLPNIGLPAHIEMSLRGEKTLVDEAMDFLKTTIINRGLTWSDQLTDK